jgi:hypothetical protein
MFSSLASANNDMTRLVAQARLTGHSEGGSLHYLLREQEHIDGRYCSSGEELPDIKAEVTEKPSGVRVDTCPPEGTFGNSQDGRSGQSMLEYMTYT